MPPLPNPRHEKFCVALAKGCTKQEASRRAGYRIDKSGVTPARLMKRPEVLARVEELRHETAAYDIADIIERKILLTEIIRDRDAPLKNRISAIAELNRMDGAYAPAKVETSSQAMSVKRIIYRIGNRDYDEIPSLPPGP